ncbi:hypothetical protein [Ancylobacter rudongensis]|uniref:ParG protein n=1 Tax=Ancylobacter rudongensis TaxID=177413 RepID=A0A1G4UPG8_9HYPH|nr:hypothetical protein [Ancylobacter rudongensis]SCW95551.1 hypothetical protein SAMN05660859_0053 [Ancylobacter rudongensis]
MSEEKPKTKAAPVRPQKASFLGAAAIAAAPKEAANNMNGEPYTAMTFNMPKTWHRRFKATASMHDLSMKDLLIQSFEAWEARQKELKD